MATAKKTDLAKRKQPTVPPVGGHGDMARVLGLTVVRRQTLDAAQDALCEAIETDQAQAVASHLAARERLLASTQALEAKVREAVA